MMEEQYSGKQMTYHKDLEGGSTRNNPGPGGNEEVTWSLMVCPRLMEPDGNELHLQCF